MRMHGQRPLGAIPDDELLRRLAELINQSRRVEADLVAHIGEFDERRLYAREAAPSMFAYCMEVLHLSEAEAYLRITVARTCREFPQVHGMLRDGRLHLSGIVRLAPHLNRVNADGLLHRAAHRSKRQIEELIAEIAPRADAPEGMRKLPGRAPLAFGIQLVPDGVVSTTEPHPERPVPSSAFRPAAQPLVEAPTVVEPLSPDRYKVQFTGSKELCDKLERLRALMRHEVPGGDLAAIIEKAVSEKLERMEAKRYGTTARTRRLEAAPGRVVAPRPGRDSASGVEAGSPPMSLLRRPGATVPGAEVSRVPPSTPVRDGRSPRRGEHPFDLSFMPISA
jgi:hypothetical protein